MKIENNNNLFEQIYHQLNTLDNINLKTNLLVDTFKSFDLLSSSFIPKHIKMEINKTKKTGILKNLPKTFEATRYHSLIIEKKSLSKNLEITAETEDGLIMGVQHKEYNIHGVQFHPESIKTKLGMKILKNFISY